MKIVKVIYFNITLLISILVSINNAGAQTSGCTDPLATNYNPSATKNDGSCIYNPGSVTPAASFNLVSTIDETSGLIRWNDQVWTHNDSEDINIYALDTANGTIIQSYPLTGTINNDWEEISQDNDYIYIGDFGNNANGNRTDLKILRIRKNSVLVNPIKIDTINYSYSDQTNFTPTDPNETDFDCEAFIVSSDSIYLFTKQWVSEKTSIYSLPKTPGTCIAKKKSTYDVNGLVTGAVYLQSKRLVVLCGYSALLEPFIYLLYDFNGTDFFSGNKRKIAVSLAYHQTEGIATTNGLKYYLSNEYFSYILTIPQKLHILNLYPFLKEYLESVPSAVNKYEIENEYAVYPVPADDFIIVERSQNIQEENYFLINYLGNVVMTGKLDEEENRIDIESLPSGFYILKVSNKANNHLKVIKR